MRNLLSIAIFVVATCFLQKNFAQIPNFEIYHCKVVNENGKLAFSNIKNISAHVGYDNQPTFSRDGNLIYFTSIRDSIQADIYAHDLRDGGTRQITNTEESEYSPVFIGSGEDFTVVRVEKDSVQRLWQFTKNATSQKVITNKIDSIGYYCRIDENRYAFFRVTVPFTLVLADIKKQQIKTIDANIGRCIKLIPGENAISYLVKSSEDTWVIKKYDLTTNIITRICDIPAGTEDFIWTSDGNLLMAKGNQFWMYHYKNENPEWKMIAELKELAGKNIYRLALAPDGLSMAFVADE